MKVTNGYLTVYMTLCMTLLLSLFLTLIDGARRNGAAMEAACVTEIGMESIMAEYHRELLNQYNLFAVDSSYGTGKQGIENTEAHLIKYLKKNLSYDDVFLSSFLYRDFFGLQLDAVEMTGVSILTDDEGAVFRRRCAEAVEDDFGLSTFQELQKWLEVIEVNGFDSDEIQIEKAEADRQIQEYSEEGQEGEQQKRVENPTLIIEEQRNLGILRLAIGDEELLSHNTLDLSGLIGNRMEQGMFSQGNLTLSETQWTQDLTERFFFQEYLLQYMGRYGNESEQDALKYQMEYLIAGKENDIENLRNVANRICAIREAANALYLWSDQEKLEEVKLVAEGISSLLMTPELAPVLETAIILGWAYAESVYDVKVLLSGGRGPLIKDSETWHYGLQGALAGSLNDTSEDTSKGDGMKYEDYLRVFMSFASLDKLTIRAMNMVEADIRMTEGNQWFCLDGCYDRVQFDIRISSSFGYEYQLSREKSYG